MRHIIKIMFRIEQLWSIENWQVNKSFVKIIYNWLHIYSNISFIFSKQVRYVCVVHVMHNIVIFFLPFKKPLAKEIVVKGSRSLVACAKLLEFQRLFLHTKKFASKEEPMEKISTMSLWNNWLSSLNLINKCTIRCNINWNQYEVL